MKPRCRLCDQRVVDDSIFCARHRAQAQRFSLSFGTQEDASEAEPTAADIESEPAPAEPALPPQPEPSAPPVAAPERTADEAGEERAVLAAAFHAAFDALRTRLTDEADPGRWPQLSLYFLDDTLHCRAYFSIVPGEPSDPAFALDEAHVHAALANGGVVFEELHAQFSACAGRLRQRTLQTLDVHFLTYAGLIAINAHPPGRKVENLVTFELEGGEFHEVALDDDVRALMRHEHW
jgi:hypothetical protein